MTDIVARISGRSGPAPNRTATAMKTPSTTEIHGVFNAFLISNRYHEAPMDIEMAKAAMQAVSVSIS